MKTSIVALLSVLALTTNSQAEPSRDTRPQSDDFITTFKFMGDISCGGWRTARSSASGNIQSAALLNYTLGILAGRASKSGFDTLEYVEISSIEAWLDDYCGRNPLDSLIKATYQLEAEVSQKYT